MSARRDWWFDGDLSECYYAWGHVDRTLFAGWVQSEEDPGSDPVLPQNVEHLWATDGDDGRFHIVKHGNQGHPFFPVYFHKQFDDVF